MTPETIVFDVLNFEFDIIPSTVNMTLGQLGLDSLDQVELLIQLEEATGVIDTGAETFNSNTTVAELISTVATWGKTEE